MTTVSTEPLGALLDQRRIPRGASTRASADGIFDLLPSSSGVAARSRRTYSAHPFDHRSPMSDPNAFERGLSPLARRLADVLPRQGTVLETGSGPGHMTAWLRSKGIPVLAADQSRESLRLLRERTDATAVAADVSSLPFADSAFGAVLADGVVHHTVQPAKALRELVRVLKPGGLLFVRIYRAEGRYPVLYRSIGGVLRALDGLSSRSSSFVWRLAFPAYRFAANQRYGRLGEEPGRHDEGVFSDYFLTPRATPMRGSSFLAALRRLGLDIVAYEPYRNVHGFLARKRASRSS